MQIATPPAGTNVIAEQPAGESAIDRRSRISDWRWRAGAIVATLLLVGAGTLSAINVEGDTGSDILGLGRLIGRDLLRLRWQFAAIVLVLAGLHYLAAAIAARAASGEPLALGEATLVQFAAAAADRLTPGGVGAAAVNARYFTRRGLTLPASLGAVTALHVVGPITDIAVLAFLVFAGQWVGLNGGARELQALLTKIDHFVAPLLSPWVWAGIGTLVGAVLLVRRLRTSRRRRDWTTFWVPVLGLARNPARLATLAFASAATTFILAFAFVASIAMVPGPRPAAALGALLIAFMLGVAPGGALPIPAGVGTTEAALIAVLVGVQVPAASAVQQVLLFRIITFWLPAVIGIVAAHHLRKREAL